MLDESSIHLSKAWFPSRVGRFAQQETPERFVPLREKSSSCRANPVTKESCFSEEYLLRGVKVKEHRPLHGDIVKAVRRIRRNNPTSAA